MAEFHSHTSYLNENDMLDTMVMGSTSPSLR